MCGGGGGARKYERVGELLLLLLYVRVARMAGPLTQVQGLHHKMFCGGSPLPGATLYHCEMMF